MDDLACARSQMARSLAFHIVFTVIGIGMPVPDLTFAATRTAESTLRMLAWTLAIGALVVFPSFAYLFVVVKTPEVHEAETREAR